MIDSFRGKDAERLIRRQPGVKLSKALRPAGLRKLLVLDAAQSLDDLRAIPGTRLEKLKGGRAGEYSIRINDQWRICFRWQGGNAEDVEIVDYH